MLSRQLHSLDHTLLMFRPLKLEGTDLSYVKEAVYSQRLPKQSQLQFKPVVRLELLYVLYNIIKADIQLGEKCSITVVIVL